MGLYINPTSMAKEQWLETNAELITQADAEAHDYDDKSVAILCLVRNPMFSACALAYSRDELAAFTMPTDHRPKAFYKVTADKLLEDTQLSLDDLKRVGFVS